jgi:RimJ/RimL family protein N-acetyltransferase
MNQADPAVRIADDLVALRDFTDADVNDVAAACNDPEIARWTATIPVPYTEDHARSWIAQHEAWRRDERAHVFAIVGHGDRRIGGSIALESLDAPPVQVGYWVAPWSRDRGYASHALALVCRWAFDHLDVDRLELVTKTGNVRSERVALHAGFERETSKVGYRPHNARDETTHDVTCWALQRPVA